MSTTLTNGLKLPDKGSVDWYADMQSNYAILDGAVGTVAEHTTALAGKAPAVHTHTKSDITDFPAYGNTAGTICEGNDSRLSDARTPVAHTHGKADITDLFNSANTWSANNIYTYAITLKQTNLEEGVLPASNQTKRFGITDKNNANLGWLQHRINTSGDSYLEFYVVNKFSNGQLSSQGSEIANVLNLGLHSDGSRYFTVTGDVYPDLPTRVCNLGTAANQWNNLYAKKTNTNTVKAVTGTLTLQSNGTDKSIGIYNGDGATDGGGFWAYGKDHSNGSLCRIQIYNTSKSRYERVDLVNSQFFPVPSGEIDLGTSTAKWKSFNGINPGALSFPEGTTDNANTTFNPDLTDWLRDGTAFTITAQVTGWLHIRIKNSTGNFAWVKRGTAGVNQTWGIVGNSDTNSDIVDISLNVPVIQNYAYTLKIKSSTLYAAIFMCLGNV